jgi:hypothetical protein
VTERLDPSLVRRGRVNGRYFRENFAQGGIDLVQIIPELVTNADSAIALGARPSGRIVLRFGPPDPGFAGEWKRAMRRLRAPALLDWRHELRCSDDGVGMDAAAVDRRLGALGVLPDAGGQRGLLGRGQRDVWLAQGGGRLEGVRDAPFVESWFFPSGGDDPYAYVHVRDEPANQPSGTRITVPLASAAGRRRTRGCGGSSASSCSCGRCSRIRRASYGWSCPARARSSSRFRRRSRTPSGRCCPTRRSRWRRAWVRA